MSCQLVKEEQLQWNYLQSKFNVSLIILAIYLLYVIYGINNCNP